MYDPTLPLEARACLNKREAPKKLLIWGYKTQPGIILVPILPKLSFHLETHFFALKGKLMQLEIVGKKESGFDAILVFLCHVICNTLKNDPFP